MDRLLHMDVLRPSKVAELFSWVSVVKSTMSRNLLFDLDLKAAESQSAFVLLGSDDINRLSVSLCL